MTVMAKLWSCMATDAYILYFVYSTIMSIMIGKWNQ